MYCNIFSVFVPFLDQIQVWFSPTPPQQNFDWWWCWRWNSSTLATWCEELTHWKKPWYWERLKAGGEGDNRGWDDWMTSPTQWTWVWVNSRSWRWTGRPDVHGVTKSWTRLSDWIELMCIFISRGMYVWFIFSLSLFSIFLPPPLPCPT